MANRVVDFTNTELCLQRMDSISSIGSFGSFDDDSDTESTDSSSSRRDEDRGTNIRHCKYRRNLTAPELPRLTAEWGRLDLKPKSKPVRKTKSLDDKDKVDDVYYSKNRWASSSSSDLLEEGCRWSSTTQLRRTSTSGSDSTPRIPRASAPDLKIAASTRRHALEEDRKNASWTSKNLSPKPSISTGNLALSSSSKARSPRARVSLNARWSSSSSGLLDSLVASSAATPKKKPLPLRGSLSRWNSSSSFGNSSSSFKTTASSVTSMDQWSTKPNIPKRRRRSDQSKKKEEEGGEEQEANASFSEIIAKPEPVKPEPQVVEAPAVAAQELQVQYPTGEDVLEDGNQTQATAAEDDPEEVSEGDECNDSEKEDLDTFQQMYGSIPSSCLDCFETILEEEAINEDEGTAGTATSKCLHPSTRDCMLRVPRRRQSANSILTLDEMDLSVSLSVSNASSGSSCRRRGSGEFAQRHEGLGPRLPCRRASINRNLMRGESFCSLSSSCSDESPREYAHRRASPKSPHGTRMVRRAWCKDENKCHPLLDERHPLAASSSTRTTSKPSAEIVDDLCASGRSLLQRASSKDSESPRNNQFSPAA